MQPGRAGKPEQWETGDTPPNPALQLLGSRPSELGSVDVCLAHQGDCMVRKQNSLMQPCVHLRQTDSRGAHPQAQALFRLSHSRSHARVPSEVPTSAAAHLPWGQGSGESALVGAGVGVDGGGGLALRAPPAQGSGGLGLRAPRPGRTMLPLPIKEPFANPTRGWQDQADHFLPWCLDEETEAYAPVGGAPEPIAGRQCALGARRRGILGESLCPSCASGGAPSPESVSGVPSTDSVALQDPRACPSPPSPQAAPQPAGC